VLKLNPQEIVIEDNAIEKIPKVLEKLGNFKSILSVSGKTTFKLVGKKIANNLSKNYRVRNMRAEVCDESTLNCAIKKNKELKLDLILGIGGGKNIDLAKAIAYNLNKPWISIPTIPSHDGIASNRAVISKDKGKYPLLTKPPLAVIADLDVLSKAPFRFFAAGCGDIIAKVTAVLDWQLARDRKGEEFDKYAANLASTSAELIINNAKNYKKNYKLSVKLLMKALINCSDAMVISNSSRPCSGSEHMFCHTIDNLYPKNTALHGEKVGLGAYIMSFLHGIDYEKIRDALVSYDLPVNSKEIKIPSKILVEALSTAHKIRSDMRYTILRDGISEDEAKRMLKKLDVI
jgi:glycerol-1-phosphate dehydrogenase [NAD(P)+]